MRNFTPLGLWISGSIDRFTPPRRCGRTPAMNWASRRSCAKLGVGRISPPRSGATPSVAGRSSPRTRIAGIATRLAAAPQMTCRRVEFIRAPRCCPDVRRSPCRWKAVFLAREPFAWDGPVGALLDQLLIEDRAAGRELDGETGIVLIVENRIRTLADLRLSGDNIAELDHLLAADQAFRDRVEQLDLAIGGDAGPVVDEDVARPRE